MPTSLGVIITNRDRTETLRNCLLTLSIQAVQPRWVALADLGSEPRNARALKRLAKEFRAIYLRIDYTGPWNQGLAFNTALRRMPAVSHVSQVDADMILHPRLMAITVAALRQVDALACVASYARRGAVSASFDGSLSAYCSILRGAFRGNAWSLGGYMTLPREWLIAYRGIEESFVGWGFQNSDLWRRAESSLATCVERTGALVIHQWHSRQPGASTFRGNPNWSLFESRRLEGTLEANSTSFWGGMK